MRASGAEKASEMMGGSSWYDQHTEGRGQGEVPWSLGEDDRRWQSKTAWGTG